MLKVVWNKVHTWKILKRYVNGRLESFKYNGEWYVPIALVLATIGISILARLEEKLNEAFSNPNWMNKEEEQ